MVKETVLILGASGMVGSKFVESYGKEFELLTPDEVELDLTDYSSLKKYFDKHQEIGAVVNFAAYTNVSEGQKQKGDKNAFCWKINVVGAENLVKVLKGKNVFVVQISTDMVFPGDSEDPGPYEESHQVKSDEDKLTWYGYTKAAAEKILADGLRDKLAILRIIYPVTREYGLKMDYLRGPLDYYERNKQLYPIFGDQMMNISDIDEVNLTIKKIVDGKVVGVFHGGSADITSPYKITKRLFELVYGSSEMVKPGLLAEFLKTANDPTRYPQFGGLVNRETQKKLGIKYSSSDEIVQRLYRRN